MLVACGRADAEKLEYAMSQYTGDVPFKADVHFDALVTEARLCLVYFCFFDNNNPYSLRGSSMGG